MLGNDIRRMKMNHKLGNLTDHEIPMRESAGPKDCDGLAI